MRGTHKFTVIALLILAEASVLWLTAIVWNHLQPAIDLTLIILPALIISASLFYLFWQAWTSSPAVASTEKLKKEAEVKGTVSISRDKQLSRTEAINIEGIARKINREYNPDAVPEEIGKTLLKVLAAELEIMTGIYYSLEKDQVYRPTATYAYSSVHSPRDFTPGNGINGQAVENKQVLLIRDLPADYLQVYSGLGGAQAAFLALVPVMTGETVTALIECAGFRDAGNDLQQLFNLVSANLTAKNTQLTSKEK